MRMFKEPDGTFYFNEAVEVGYCPVCDRKLYVKPYERVKGKMLTDYHIHDSTLCFHCGHRVEVLIPCERLSLPRDTEIIELQEECDE